MLSILAVVLSALSLVLHAIAPRTKTTIDDRAADAVDAAAKLVPVVGQALGQSTSPTSAPKAVDRGPVVTGFGPARDHRVAPAPKTTK